MRLRFLSGINMGAKMINPNTLAPSCTMVAYYPQQNFEKDFAQSTLRRTLLVWECK